MLVLARRPNETINIHTSDGIIKIHLNSCDHYQARLGFEAPNNVKILRTEIDTAENSAKFSVTHPASNSNYRNKGGSLLRALFTRGSTERHTTPSE